MKAHVVVVGSLNMDVVARVERLPLPGETVLAEGDVARVPGGKGANQAVAASRLGANVAMVGRVGKDAFGDQLMAALKAAAVDTQHVSQDKNSGTGIAMITVDAAGQNSIVVVSGANGRLTEVVLCDARPLIESADVLVLQLETPLPTVIAAARWAKERGVLVVLNPAPAIRIPVELLAHVDVLVPNETEAAIVLGHPLDSGDATEWSSIGPHMPGTIIVTRGRHGSTLYQKGGNQTFPAFAVRAVDTTAAGDAFLAALAVAMAEGEEVEEAIRFASAAGALAVTLPGAQPSLPHREAVKRLMSTNAFESKQP